ncbi:MAG TPA: NucA/NucB deoxyribonuclease domain-containing protein [Verrucomicrobiae bacterium]|nr:NucA/NucB deoxyribonuclease domain-containing protein [Verrucomicrobiae bacterium]
MSLFDVLAPVNASVARGGQSPWGGQRAALEHSRNVTQPILKTVTATGYAVVAGPTLVASGAQIAPSGAAIFNTAVTLSHSPAAVATTSALVTGAVVYHDTGDAKAAIGSAAFVGLDAYATGAFGGRGSSGPAKPAVTAKETNQQTEIAVIRVDAKTHPESAAHIQEAQAAGQPSVLTVDRAAAAGRRKEALQGQPVVSGKDRDEYPPAMFAEGGAGASVKPISRSDNRGAGASMGQQARGLADGEKAKIEVVNRHDKE